MTKVHLSRLAFLATVAASSELLLLVMLPSAARNVPAFTYNQRRISTASAPSVESADNAFDGEYQASGMYNSVPFSRRWYGSRQTPLAFLAAREDDWRRRAELPLAGRKGFSQLYAEQVDPPPEGTTGESSDAPGAEEGPLEGPGDISGIVESLREESGGQSSILEPTSEAPEPEAPVPRDGEPRGLSHVAQSIAQMRQSFEKWRDEIRRQIEASKSQMSSAELGLEAGGGATGGEAGYSGEGSAQSTSESNA